MELLVAWVLSAIVSMYIIIIANEYSQHHNKPVNKYLLLILSWVINFVLSFLAYDWFEFKCRMNMWHFIVYDVPDDIGGFITVFPEYWRLGSILHLIVLILFLLYDIPEKIAEKREREHPTPKYEITKDPIYQKVYSDEEIIQQYEINLVKAQREVARLSNVKQPWCKVTANYRKNLIDYKLAEENLEKSKRDLRRIKKRINSSKELCGSEKAHVFFRKLYPTYNFMTFNTPDNSRMIMSYDYYHIVQNNLFILYVKYNLGLRFSDEKNTLELIDISRYDETNRELLAGEFMSLCNMAWDRTNNFNFLYNWDNAFGWYTCFYAVREFCTAFNIDSQYRIDKFIRQRIEKAHDLRLEAEKVCSTVEIDGFDEISSKRIDTVEWFDWLKSLNKRKWKDKNVFDFVSKPREFRNAYDDDYSIKRETCNTKFYYKKDLKKNKPWYWRGWCDGLDNSRVGHIGFCLWYYLYSQKCESKILCVGSTLYKYLTNSERFQLSECLRNKSKLKRLRKLLDPDMTDEERIKLISKICNEP